MSDLHHEKHLEAYVVSKLREQGWQLGSSDRYDADYAMYPEDLEAWLIATQKEKWEKLVAGNGAKARQTLMARLEKELATRGTIDVLRKGFALAGCGALDMSKAAPEDQRNADVLHRYASNILRVVPQLKYHPGRELAIDLGLFLNGLADRKRGRCVRAEMDLSPTTRNDARAKDLVEIVSRGSVIKDDRWQ